MNARNLPVATLHAAATAPDAPASARDPRRAEYEANKLTRRLQRQVGEAIGDYALIEAGDRVMVCLSGGTC